MVTVDSVGVSFILSCVGASLFWKFTMLSRQCTGRGLCDGVTYC